MRHRSASTDEVDYFDPIVCGQGERCEGGAVAQNRSVVLDYDRARIER